MILEVVGLGLVQMVASEVSFEYFDQWIILKISMLLQISTK